MEDLKFLGIRFGKQRASYGPTMRPGISQTIIIII